MKSFNEFRQQLMEGGVKDIHQTIRSQIGPIFKSGRFSPEQKHRDKAVDAVVKQHNISKDDAKKMVDSYCKTPTCG